MTDTTTVDAPLETAGEDTQEPSQESAGKSISGSELANMFATPPAPDAPEEPQDDNDDESREEPVIEPVEESEPTEDNSDNDENGSLTINDTSEKEVEQESNDPEWYVKRIDKITAQNKAREEELEARIASLEEGKPQETPTIDQVTSVEQLDQLEQQAQDAEDQVDEILDGDPEYDGDGNAVWVVGDQKLTKSQLIDIRKNARQTYRAIPKKRQVIAQVSNYRQAVEKEYSFFTDETDPYYEFAQQTINSPMLKKLELEFPEAAGVAALAVRGKMAVDAEAKVKEAPKKLAKKATIKSTPPKAPVDTGTVAQPRTPEESATKQTRKLIRTGNVSSKQAINIFKQ
jgi:hypothetical protein